MKKVLLVCFMALFSVATWAANFSVTNEDNVEIFYNIVDGGVEVTWGGDSYSSAGTESYVGSLEIPASVSYEGTPYSVVGIGDHAFYYCAELTGVSLPETVTSVGSYAFYHCGALNEMSLPDAVTSLGDHVFYYCTALQSITLSSSLTTIPSYCFYQCQKLESVTLPATITTIGDCAFDNCWVISGITLPEGLVSIGYEAFYGCGITSIEFPSTLTTLGDEAFMDASLTSVYVPKTITSIGMSVFQECRDLTDVTLEEGLTYLSWNMFYDCESLEQITIPSSITDMGIMTFGNCYSLHEVTLTEGITASIGMSTFTYCESLESINIPGSVPEIGYSAFSECHNLSDVTLNAGLKTIGETAFEQCEAIEKITIPSTVTSIGYGAFEGCWQLQEITTLNPTPPTIEDYVFDGEEVTTYVPAGTLAEYASEWDMHSWNLSFEELGYAVLKITLADNSGVGYATYYNGDYDVTIPEGITAYWAENVEDGVVTLTEITSSIPAKTAVVLKGDLTDIAEANATSSSSRSSYTENLLHGQSLTGMLEEEEDGAYLYYMLTTNTDGENLGFYWGNSNGSAFSSKANKAWLAVPSGQSNSLSIKFKDNETTGITSVETEVGATTVSGIYTLQGVRVSDMNQKGVYIVNGKKVLVK